MSNLTRLDDVTSSDGALYKYFKITPWILISFKTQSISQTPSDNDPWSVQLLERLLDQSIAAHFPHFDFPHWDLLNPEIPPSSPENPSEEQESLFDSPDYTLPVPEEQDEQKSAPEYVSVTRFKDGVTEDGIPSPSPPPFQDDDEIPSPSPPLEQVPSQDAYYPANTQQQDGEEVIPSPILDPSLNAVVSGDTFWTRSGEWTWTSAGSHWWVPWF